MDNYCPFLRNAVSIAVNHSENPIILTVELIQSVFGPDPHKTFAVLVNAVY